MKDTIKTKSKQLLKQQLDRLKAFEETFNHEDCANAIYLTIENDNITFSDELKSIRNQIRLDLEFLD